VASPQKEGALSIYHNPDDDPDTKNDWAIMVRSLHKERMLGTPPRFRESEVDDDAIMMLEDVFRQAASSSGEHWPASSSAALAGIQQDKRLEQVAPIGQAVRTSSSSCMV
jgi:hypothetical protein